MKKLPTLQFCILMDLIGCASYLLPGLGEISDLIWAPISGFIFYKAFGGKIGLYGGLFDFLEEILPGTDIIPTFTIVWLWKKYFSGKEIPAKPKKPAGIFSSK